MFPGSAGITKHGVQYAIKLMYEHNLQRTAFSFCYGPFGGIKSRDFICVQSVDGTVSFFEQESFAFSRFLPGALLPGPLAYVPKTDSFVTVSSTRHVECYKYQILAVAKDASSKEEYQNIKSGKKVTPDWTLNIGEQACDLAVVSFPNAPYSIYVLGDRNLFCISELGKMRFMKKLDFNPSCFLPYASLSDGHIHCMIGSHTQTLMILEDTTLKWAAQLDIVPVSLRVANFTDLKGGIVSLDECGKLQCFYLGTDPALFSAAPVSSRWEYNIGDIDQEMKILQQKIREQSHKGIVLPTIKSEDEVSLDAHIPLNLDEPSKAHDVEFEDEDPIPSLTVKVIMKTKMHVSNVKLAVHAPAPLTTNQSLMTFSNLDPGRPIETDIVFHMKQNYMPASLKADVTVSYQNSTGAPRVAQLSIKLPLKLVVKAAMPFKTSNYKLTIDSNKSTLMLNEVFSDLLLESTAGQGNALGFQVYGGPVVTVLASKTAKKYRLQCDVFEALWLLTNELVNRVKGYFGSRGQSDFRIFFEGQMPFHEYYEVIDSHFDCRLKDEKLKEELSNRATQFRAIQRRLLTRFKDKTPAPLQNLDTLLDGSYRQLLALADQVEENRQLQTRRTCELSSATHLITLLIKLSTGMSEKEFAVLCATFMPDVSGINDQGWEETVDAAMTHLLRTVLSKNVKDQTVNPSPLAVPKDTSKMKKHIAMICDRLTKGGKLIIEGYEPSKVHSVSSAPTRSEPKKDRITIPRAGVSEDAYEESSPDIGEPEVPVGSKYGGPVTRARNGLPPISESQRNMNINDLVAPEPTFEPGKKDFRKKKKETQEDVPDLDELGSMESDGYLINGSNEMVYGI